MASDAMSAVKTGMPALFASTMDVPIALESHGQRMMASTLRTMKSMTWLRCFAGSNSPLVTRVVIPWILASAVIASAMSLKNGFVSVSTEMPITVFGRSAASSEGMETRAAEVAMAKRRRVIGFMEEQ